MIQTIRRAKPVNSLFQKVNLVAGLVLVAIGCTTSLTDKSSSRTILLQKYEAAAAKDPTVRTPDVEQLLEQGQLEEWLKATPAARRDWREWVETEKARRTQEAEDAKRISPLQEKLLEMYRGKDVSVLIGAVGRPDKIDVIRGSLFLKYSRVQVLNETADFTVITDRQDKITFVRVDSIRRQ